MKKGKSECVELDFIIDISSNLTYFLWSLEFLESVDRRTIHQLVATYKTNMKTTVVFRHPSDGKVSLFLEDLELRTASILMKNLVPFVGVSCSVLWKEKRGSVFFEQ